MYEFDSQEKRRIESEEIRRDKEYLIILERLIALKISQKGICLIVHSRYDLCLFNQKAQENKEKV